jgi:hypothetical protein
LQNVTAQGNSIRKTSGLSATWDAGAASSQSLIFSTGYVEITVDDLTTYKLFGLSNGDANPTQADVDFAFFMAGGVLKVYESGVLRNNFGSYAVGDTLRVSVDVGGVIHYYRNGALLYTSAFAPTYPLVLDTSINSLGGSLTNANICGPSLQNTPTPAATASRTSTLTETPKPTATRTPTSPPAATQTRTATRTATTQPTATRTAIVQSTATRTATAAATSTPGGGPTLGGCPMFPVNNIWNRNVASLLVHAQSDQFVAALGANQTLHPAFGSGTWNGYIFGMPFNLVPASQPLVNINIYQYPGESDPGPARIPRNAVVQAPTDSHVVVLETGTCTLYEMYHGTPVPDGSWNAGSAARFNMNSNALRPNGWTSSDAAGFAILPGLIRYDEAVAGPPRHAIRFTGQYNGIRNTYVWPARHSDGRSTDPNAPPMGTRFRLKASYNISGYPQPLRNILQGLKDYGMIVSDSTDPGDSWNIEGAPDERWNNTMLHTMNNIPGSAFEAVDVSGLMVDPNSGQSR